MKQTVNLNDFRQAFVTMGRADQFTYEGLAALFDYLEDWDEQTGTESELDVIDICCEFTELDEKQARQDYDIPDDEDWTEWLHEETSVIAVDDGRVIIQNF